MSAPPLRIVFLGLSITSSWGNGHATTYRGLVRELGAQGHDVLFLERDASWYASNRDLLTLAKLARGDCEYLSPALIRRYALYLSFTGGPTLEHLEQCYGAPRARPFY